MTWHQVQSKIEPYLVRIETEQGSGSGFLFAYNPENTFAAIATAAHVIGNAHEWKQPIRLIHHATGHVAFVTEDMRVIFVDYKRDAATILVPKELLPFPADTFPLADSSKCKKVGVEIAWTGFPSVAYPNLCFFSGRVSCFLEEQDCYLIDGVAINGVSGGPVFSQTKDNTPEVIGIISAYIPNISGNTPGLLRAQDITPFDIALKTLRSLHEAKQQEKTRDQSAAKAGTTMPPTSDNPAGEPEPKAEQAADDKA